MIKPNGSNKEIDNVSNKKIHKNSKPQKEGRKNQSALKLPSQAKNHKTIYLLSLNSPPLKLSIILLTKNQKNNSQNSQIPSQNKPINTIKEESSPSNAYNFYCNTTTFPSNSSAAAPMEQQSKIAISISQSISPFSHGWKFYPKAKKLESHWKKCRKYLHITSASQKSNSSKLLQYPS